MSLLWQTGTPQWLWLRPMSTRAKVSPDTSEHDILLLLTFQGYYYWGLFSNGCVVIIEMDLPGRANDFADLLFSDYMQRI